MYVFEIIVLIIHQLACKHTEHESRVRDKYQATSVTRPVMVTKKGVTRFLSSADGNYMLHDESNFLVEAQIKLKRETIYTLRRSVLKLSKECTINAAFLRLLAAPY